MAKTATIAGITMGRPKSLSSSVLPGNRPRRARARATGRASATDIRADSAACNVVNSSTWRR